MKEVAPGIWVEHGYESGNVGFIVTGAGVVCIDVPMMPDDARHWLYSIRDVTDEPITALVQTDYDQARVLSTCLVDARVIAHEAAWEDMLKIYNRDKTVQQIVGLLGHNGNWHVRMPDITFTEHVILRKGTQEIHLLHGGGHSAATCMVHLPEHRLMFTGDVVFNDVHPSMEYAESGAWFSALRRLRKVDVDMLVPGHGAVQTYPHCQDHEMARMSETPMPLSGKKGPQNAPPQGSDTIDSDADAHDCRTRSTHPSPFPTQELKHTRVGRRART